MRDPRGLPASRRASSVEAVFPALDALADRVRRLRPSHRDPEAFHVEKDAIERALRRLARQGGPFA